MDTLSSINMQRLMRERSMQDSIEKKEQIAEVRMQKITDQRRMLTAVCTLAVVLLLLLIIIIIVLRSRNRMIKSIVEQNVRAVEKQKRIETSYNADRAAVRCCASGVGNSNVIPYHNRRQPVKR